MTTLGGLVRQGVLEFSDGYRTKRDEQAMTGFRILRAGDVHGGRIHPDGPDFVADTYASAIGGKSARVGDVVLTTKGTVGRTGLVADVRELVVYSPQVCFFRSSRPDAIDLRFFYHWLSSPEFVSQAGYLKSSTDMAPYISLRDLSATRIALPPLPTQRAIAEVLGALDDKITVNDKTASAADSLVRAMFERAGGGGRVMLSELFSNPRVAAKPPIEAETYVGLEHLPRRLMWLGQSGEVDGLLSGKFWFSPDDVLFGKLRPYFHKVVVADRRGVCSTDILVLRPLRPELKGYGWAAASSDAVVERVSAMSAGTRMPRTNWSDLASTEIPWPGELAALEISERVAALRDRVAAAVAESRHLATLRDTLLPHLMSGRITVRDAEKQAEEVL